jgi:beta-lactamase regulating signal transducer with metallopeptidase domain/HEAT repeat protein
MNAFAQGTAPLWDALGWTMLHFLWIGALIGLTAAILRLAVRRRTPQTRYALSLAAFVVLAIAPVCFFVWKIKQPATEATAADIARPLRFHTDLPKHIPPPRQEKTSASAQPIATPAPSADAMSVPTTIELAPTSFGKRLVTGYELAVRVFPWVWVVGFPVTGLWLLIGIGGAERLRRRCRAVDDEALLALCRRLQSVLRVSGSVAIGISERIAAPILVGIVRPVILLTTAALAGWSPEQLEMILLHELAHIRRWDNVVNLLQRLVEAALFFHPVVWWLSNRVRLEREHCCDAVVLAHTNAPQAYAETLAQIALPDLAPRWALGSSATAQLVARIRHILKQEDQPMQVSRKSIALFLAVSLGLVGLAVVWAETDRPAGGLRSAAPLVAHAKMDAQIRALDENLVAAIADSTPKPTMNSAETKTGHSHPISVPSTVSANGRSGMMMSGGIRTVSLSPPLRFEGKTFDVWQEQARTELKPESRAEAILAFGRFGSHAGYTEKSIAAIIESLKSDRLRPGDEGDAKVVEAGHWAFARIGTPAVGALAGLLKDPDLEIRRFAVGSIRQFLFAEPAAQRQAFDALVQVTKDKNMKLRAAALNALRSVSLKDYPDETNVLVQTAIDLLNDKQPLLRRDGAEILGEFGSKAASATPALLAAVKDPRNDKAGDFDERKGVGFDNGPRQAAILALAKVGAPPDTVIPALIEVLGKTPDPNDYGTVTAAATVLGHYRAKAASAVPALIEAFKRDKQRRVGSPGMPWNSSVLLNSDLRRIAWALGQIGPEAKPALPLLEQAIDELKAREQSRSTPLNGTVLKNFDDAIQQIRGNKEPPK